jgi:hypothetical protein
MAEGALPPGDTAVRSTADDESVEWVSARSGADTQRDAAVERPHQMPLRVALSELDRRSGPSRSTVERRH